jgi:transcriptional antiterminator RfaH
MNWYAIYTKPRNEKKVTETLNSMGIEAYCPMVTSIKQWSDRKKKVTAPVLPSYVFVKIEEQKRNEVFQVAGIVRYVYWLGKPAIIRPIEIEALQHSLAQDFKSIITTDFQKGDTMKIPSGPFKGYEGVIKQISPTKMQLILDSLGVIITLEV